MRWFSRILMVAIAIVVMALIAPQAEAGVFSQRTVIRQRTGFFPNRVVVNRVNVVNPAPVVVNGFGVHSFGARGFFAPQTVVVPHGGFFAPSGVIVSGGCF